MLDKYWVLRLAVATIKSFCVGFEASVIARVEAPLVAVPRSGPWTRVITLVIARIVNWTVLESMLVVPSQTENSWEPIGQLTAIVSEPATFPDESASGQPEKQTT